MLRKILLSVCVFVTVLAMPLIAKTALASPFDKAEDYQYQYIAPSNFRHFVYPVSISTTVGRITPDLIVADEIDGQTQITRFDNVETIGQYDSKASIVATLDYTVDEIAVAQSPSSEYLLSLSENTLRISNMANGNLGTPRIYENIIAFDAFEDSVYALRLNSSGVYSIVQILYSNFATNTVNVPSQNSKLSQLVIASNPRPENLDNLEYFVVQSATKIYYNIRKVENGQFLEQSFGTDAVPITHLTLSNNILFYADIYELNKIDLENNTTQERIFKVVLSAQLVGDNVYFIQQDSSAGWEGSRQLKSISISTFDEATPKILLESRSNQKHFFDAPTSTTSRQGKVFVADSNNNRIAILDDNTTTYIEVTANIISLAVSRLDTVYALTQTKNGSSIYIYSTTTKELINTINTTERLSQISIDAVDNLYAYSNSQLYCLQNNKLIELISYANPIYSIAVAPDQIGIYALYGNSVAYTISLSNIDNTNIEHISIGTKRPSSFSVDFNQNVFVLYNGGEIVKYDKQSVASTDITIPIVYSGSDTSIAISMSNIVTATGQQINVGDLLISHKNSNALIGINKDWATVEIPDWDNYTHPDYTSNGADSYVPNPVIRTVKATTTLFDYPTEMMSSGITIDENSRIILIDEQPNGNDVYSFIMLDQVKMGTYDKPVVGYILQNLLTIAKNDEYQAPLTSTASIVGSTPLYRYPSMLATPLVDSGFKLQDGNEVILLNFSSYTVQGITWARLQYYSSIYNVTYTGFVPNHFLNMSNYFRPGSQRIPRANATVNGEDVSAIIPFLSGKDTIPYTIEIPAGTRVRVVGSFNPNSSMTTVEFYDSTLNGVFTADIPTSSILFDNITITQIVAFIIGIFLVLMSIVGYVFYKSIKHKAMLAQVQEQPQQSSLVLDNVVLPLDLDDIPLVE